MKKWIGFTLIELLVVIAVIALLLAILMPVLGKARELSRRIGCANHLKTFGVANEVYASKYGGYYAPVMYRIGGTLTKWPSNKAFRECMYMDSYRTVDDETFFNLPDAFLCPSDRIGRDPENAYKNTEGGVVEKVLLSYGYNFTDWAAGWPPPEGTYGGHRNDTVPHPAEKLAFIDGIDWWVEWGAADYEDGWDILGQATIRTYKNAHLHGCPRDFHGPTIYRHDEGANIGFYDGHSEYRKKEDIYIEADYLADPQRPGMWVANAAIFFGP